MFDSMYHGSHVYDSRFASVVFPRTFEKGVKTWHFDICDYGISVSPNAEGIGTPEFLEAFKQAQQLHRELFDDTMLDEDRSDYAIRWRETEYPFKFQWIMGMTDGAGNWLDDDWGYKTLVVLDNKWIHQGEKESPIVTHYMDVDWHKRVISELTAMHHQQLREREIAVIKRFSVESPASILKDVEAVVIDRVQRGVEQGIAQAIQDGTATLKQVQTEKQRLEEQLRQLEAAEQRIKAREELEAKREQERLERKANRTTDGYVYVLRQVGGDYYKIGHTNNPDKRKTTFDVKLPFAVEFDVLIKTADRFTLERDLHARYASKRVNGEWFNLSSEDLEYLRSLSTA